MEYNKLDIRDIAIIDAFPIYQVEPLVLNVGCGEGRIDFNLYRLGYKVYAIDNKEHNSWENKENETNFLKFSQADIFNLESFPIKNAPIVICSEVLEHLVKYKKALKNLIELTKIRLIITVPFEKSFNSPKPPPIGHCNFWSDKKRAGKYKDINEFHKLCLPYCVSISKIRTKVRDVKMRQFAYLIVIDKRQNLNF